MNLGLQEKVVLVTGASKGLGEAINAGSIGRFAAFEGLSSEAARLSPGPICALMAVQLPVYKEGIRKLREQREKQGLKRRQLS